MGWQNKPYCSRLKVELGNGKKKVIVQTQFRGTRNLISIFIVDGIPRYQLPAKDIGSFFRKIKAGKQARLMILKKMNKAIEITSQIRYQNCLFQNLLSTIKVMEP